MPKWLKFVVALLLLPACAGAGRALAQVLARSGAADTTWVPLLAGAAGWLLIYLSIPRPMWLYVLGHELTHAVWTWLFLGRVKRLKASAKGGHVVITKSNFLITLAPYFFPFHAVLVVLIFLAGHLLWGWTNYQAWFHLCLGAAYAFHLTLTGHILKTQQSDITSQGYLFSGVVIYLGNITVLLATVPPLTGGRLTDGFRAWLHATTDLCHRLANWL